MARCGHQLRAEHGAFRPAVERATTVAPVPFVIDHDFARRLGAFPDWGRRFVIEADRDGLNVELDLCSSDLALSAHARALWWAVREGRFAGCSFHLPDDARWGWDGRMMTLEFVPSLLELSFLIDCVPVYPNRELMSAWAD
jgi:hypothetical protein